MPIPVTWKAELIWWKPEPIWQNIQFSNMKISHQIVAFWGYIQGLVRHIISDCLAIVWSMWWYEEYFRCSWETVGNILQSSYMPSCCSSTWPWSCTSCYHNKYSNYAKDTVFNGHYIWELGYLKWYAHQNDYENSINLQWLSGLSSVFSRVAHRSRPWCTDVTCNTETTTAL